MQLRGVGILCAVPRTESPNVPCSGWLDIGILAIKQGQKHDHKNVSILW